ncbi:MAG: DNA repair exonuclease, partial [Kurthia sp.]
MGIRFFHTADLHLDSPFKGLYNLPHNIVEKLRQSTFVAFSQLVDVAIKEKPDFIVIVGDIYDGENRSLTAQNKFQRQLIRLQEAEIPVFISYGNHDHLSGNWTRFELPNNVREFNSEVENKTIDVRGQAVTIHGFSYSKRHIVEPMIQYYPKKIDDALHIGMLHGSVEGDEAHNVYAPFTKQQLLQKNYDYWALGHIHKRQILHEAPPVVYAGNIQGRHRNEAGVKGFYDVHLEDGEAKLDFIRTSQVQFDCLQVSLAHVNYATDMIARITEAVTLYSEVHGMSMIELQLTDFTEAARVLYMKESEESWLETLREQVELIEPIVWIDRLRAMVVQEDEEQSELSKEIINKT